FNGRYAASVTVRRDGSSRLGEQWGTFPAFGLGWHISNEAWFPRNRFVSDFNLRYGYGVTGNQLIPAGRIFSQFGGSTGATFYDIGANNATITPGYCLTAVGETNLKWEEDHSGNIRPEMVLWNSNVKLRVSCSHCV